MKITLLAVCGTSPQVITETLHALHLQGRPPQAVRILTTREGQASCISNLFGAGDGAFYRWLDDYGLGRGSIDFGPSHVRAVTRRNGVPLDDILDEEDNALFLAACMESAFELTRDPDSVVYFSLSGGRKSMSACLTTAAQFYGRPQDRLFHVLVTPEFESNRNFFFPPREPREIELKDRCGHPYRKSTAYARITLVPVPFVSIRDRLTPEHLRRPESPADLLASLVREERPVLTVDLPARTLRWKGLECDLQPAHLALYTFFALIKKEASCTGSTCRGCTECFLPMAEMKQEEIAAIYRQIEPRDSEALSRKDGILCLSPENFRSYRSRILREIERAFGLSTADELEIASVGTRPGVRYGLALDRERIRIVM